MPHTTTTDCVRIKKNMSQSSRVSAEIPLISAILTIVM